MIIMGNEDNWILLGILLDKKFTIMLRGYKERN